MPIAKIVQTLQRRLAPTLIRWAPSILVRATWRLAPRPQGPLWVDTAYGTFLVDPGRRPLDSALYYHGIHEAGTVDFVLDHLKSGEILFDVGAYDGFLSIVAAQHGIAAHAVEPDPANVEIIEANIRENEAAVTIHQTAIGAEDATGFLHVADNPAANTLDTAGDLAVSVRSIDSLADEVGAPGLVKLDVEGWELPALLGAEYTLRDHRPFVIAESSRISLTGRQDPIIEHMRDRGYTAWRWRRGKDSRSPLVPASRYPRHDNLIFMP